MTLGAGAVSGGLLALILLYAVWMLRRRQRGKLAAGLASSKPPAGVANSKRRASPGGRLIAQPGRALTLSRDLESSGPLSSAQLSRCPQGGCEGGGCSVRLTTDASAAGRAFYDEMSENDAAPPPPRHSTKAAADQDTMEAPHDVMVEADGTTAPTVITKPAAAVHCTAPLELAHSTAARLAPTLSPQPYGVIPCPRPSDTTSSIGTSMRWLHRQEMDAKTDGQSSGGESDGEGESSGDSPLLNPDARPSSTAPPHLVQERLSRARGHRMAATDQGSGGGSEGGGGEGECGGGEGGGSDAGGTAMARLSSPRSSSALSPGSSESRRRRRHRSSAKKTMDAEMKVW